MNYFKAAALCFLFITGSLFSQPKISFNVTSIHLGEIVQGSVQHARYVISNTGDSALIIYGIKPGCGCTSARNPKRTLQPNESDTIEVDFNSANFTGAVSKEIYVSSSDPKSPSAVLTFTATIVTELAPIDNQYNLWLGKIATDSSASRTLYFKNAVTYPLTIRSVSSIFTDIKTEAPLKILQPGDTLSVVLTVTPVKEGYTQGIFEIDVLGKNRSSVDMRINYLGVRRESK